MTERFPWTHPGDTKSGGLRIVEVGDTAPLLRRASPIGNEHVYRDDAGRECIPWQPLFARKPNPVFELRQFARRFGCRQLTVFDDTSDATPLYGNKARKYEFTLPNLIQAGVRRVHSMGAYGSNHCAHLALACRALQPLPRTQPIDLHLDLYPQTLDPATVAKLRVVMASGAKIRWITQDVGAAWQIAKAKGLDHLGLGSEHTMVPPGGSSALSALGHINALVELEQSIVRGNTPLRAPPDLIFVSLGSGSTVVGLLLGIHVLGWKTKIVATVSQDQPKLIRGLAQGQVTQPFLLANAAQLLERSLPWIERLKLADAPILDAESLMHRYLVCNATHWRPGYGQVDSTTAALIEDAKAFGLNLDRTFTGKSFKTLSEWSQRGGLSEQSVLFWNTYQNYPMSRLLEPKHTGLA